MTEVYGKDWKNPMYVRVGWCLAFVYLLALFFTTDMGFCRDEGYYFRAGQSYITWVERAVTQVWEGKPGDAFTRRGIERYWRYNSEHPPLAKLAMGGTWWLFSKKLGWMTNAEGFRFAGMIWASLMVLVVFLWGAQAWNLRVGCFAAFAMMLLPRFFFHAHLAAFDIPVSAFWLFVTYAFWRDVREPNSSWGLWCGVLFGLALATKHNAWILPAPLGFYWLCQSWNKFRFKIFPDDSWQFRFPSLPYSLVASLFLGPLLLFALWPLLWPENMASLASWKSITWRYLRDYVVFHLKHVHYDAYYFGTLYLKPPFPISFPFGMTIVTFPLVTVILALGGVWYAIRQQRLGMHIVWWTIQIASMLAALLRPLLGWTLSIALFVPAMVLGMFSIALWWVGLLGFLVPGSVGAWFRGRSAWARSLSKDLSRDLRGFNRWEILPRGREVRPRPVGPADKTMLLWLLSAFVPMAVIALPSTPIFGGTKHWMPAWPFLALLAGVAFERICQSFKAGWLSSRSPRRQQLAFAMLGVFFLLPATIGLVRSHPHGLAYYNTLVGGPRGSANWKLQRSFWAPDMREARQWMNKHMRDRHGSTKGRVTVHFHDTNWDSYRMYLRDGLLRRRIRANWNPHNSDYIGFIHQKWLRTQLYHALSVMGARAPIYGVYLDDVPLLTFWKRNPKPTPVRW